MKNIKVGIILPAYNQGAYIDDALESLKEQTFQDFEIHLIDDGSNDGFTTQKLKSIKYDKISHKFLYKQNKGVTFRQLQQYKIMNNQYIMIFCGDDVLAPTFLEKTVKYLDEHKKCGAVGTDVMMFPEEIDPNSKTNLIKRIYKKNLTFAKIAAHTDFLGSALMRKTAIKDIGSNKGFIRFQDWDRWASMLKAGWELGNINEPLFFYRQLPSSLSHSSSVEEEMTIRRAFLEKHRNALIENFDEFYLAIEEYSLQLLKATNKQYANLYKQYANFYKQYINLRKEINDLHRSPTFKFSQKLNKATSYILPIGSRCRAFLKKLTNSPSNK